MSSGTTRSSAAICASAGCLPTIRDSRNTSYGSSTRSATTRYPIDGGVFDIPAGATEVVIPINARLAVNDPAMFAVTIERPGGVVVSAREHIVALAKVAAG